ncbi:MAG: glycosyltransferase [Gorillibacterium sp.]|nr:glycosyltransferase [Gorillibacterium sp.]
MTKSTPSIFKKIANVKVSQNKVANIPDKEIELQKIRTASAESARGKKKQQPKSSIKGRTTKRRTIKRTTIKRSTTKVRQNGSAAVRASKPVFKLPGSGHKPRRVQAKPSQLSLAYRAGNLAGVQALMESPFESNPRMLLNSDFWQWATRNGIKPEGKSYQLDAIRYAEGYCQAMRIAAFDWVPLPTTQSVAAILPITGSEVNVGQVLNQLKRLPLQEIIIVANGVDDETFADIRRHPAQPIIISYDEVIGYDIGRAIGAKLSASDILLFVDSDIIISAEKLVPFICEIDKGSSMALNNITPYLRNFSSWDAVTVVKAFVNRALGRTDLDANSLTAVPHALSRSAIDVIGYSSLAVPPLAQAHAIRAGLQVSAPASVDVISLNRRRPMNQGIGNPVENLIVGDHLEALASIMELSSERIDYPDFMRERRYGEAAP